MTTNSKLKRLNIDFEDFLDRILFETVETELTPEKKKERRAKADADDLEFAKIYFPKIFDSPWTDVHYHIRNLKTGKHTISGFRKLGKTALTYIAKIVKPLCLGVGGICNTTLRTQDVASERTAALSRMIQRNRMLCYDYNIEVLQDRKGYHIINNTVLLATSVEMGLRSYVDEEFKRFRYSINDDLYNRNSATSEHDNEKVANFIMSEIYGQMEDDGLSITLGNSINIDCPIMRLKKEFPDNHFSQPALDEDGHSTWPERFSDAYWAEKRKEIPLDVWEGEYMDRPYVRGDNFYPDMIHYVNLNLIKIIASLTACDPAHGQSPESCYKSLATLGITAKREVVMLDMYLRRESYPLLFDYMDQLRQNVPNWKAMLFENDFNQWAFAQPYYLQWMEKRKKTLTIVPHFSKGNATEFYGADKESRIMNLVHPHLMKMFLYSDLLEGQTDFKRYLQQLYSFGKAKEKLDGPDAAATAFILIFRYLDTGTFKPTKKRAWKKDRLFTRRMFR